MNPSASTLIFTLRNTLVFPVHWSGEKNNAYIGRTCKPSRCWVTRLCLVYWIKAGDIFSRVGSSSKGNTCAQIQSKYSHLYNKASLVGNRLSSCYISCPCSRCCPPHFPPCQAKLQDRKFLEDASLHLNITWIIIILDMHQCSCMHVICIHGMWNVQANVGSRCL